jgi:hypothetical protein
MCYICFSKNPLAHACPCCPIKVDPLIDNPLKGPSARHTQRTSESTGKPNVTKPRNNEERNITHLRQQTHLDTVYAKPDSSDKTIRSPTAQKEMAKTSRATSPSTKRYDPPTHNSSPVLQSMHRVLNTQETMNTHRKNEKNTDKVSKIESEQSQDSIIPTICLQSLDAYNSQTKSLNLPVARNLSFQSQEIDLVQAKGNNSGLEDINQPMDQQSRKAEVFHSFEKENTPDLTSRTPGPARQTFKQKRKHPYSGIRPGKARILSLLSAICNWCSLSSNKNILNDHQQGTTTEISAQLKSQTNLSDNTSTEEDKTITVTGSFDMSAPASPRLNEPELLQNIFGSNNI